MHDSRMAEIFLSIPVKDLKPGDKTEWYTVLQVSVTDGKVAVEVQFKDGGTGTRVWDNPEHYLAIMRIS